jgi:SAM-dependent methyltransferase
MMAAEQMRVLANMIGRIHERRILDIGTGTGRVAAMLAGGGAHVTAIDASERMLDAARRRASAQLVDVTFLRADAHALDFESRSFDVVVCLGLLMGARDWRLCLAESCRIADRLVIFDYPSATSVALIHSAIRRTFRARPYRALTRSAVADALAQSRFRTRSTHRLFMLPLWFHRGLRSRPSRRESRARSTGWVCGAASARRSRCALNACDVGGRGARQEDLHHGGNEDAEGTFDAASRRSRLGSEGSAISALIVRLSVLRSSVVKQ